MPLIFFKTFSYNNLKAILLYLKELICDDNHQSLREVLTINKDITVDQEINNFKI